MGTGLALLAPVPAALIGADWLVTVWLFAGGVAGYLAGGSTKRGFGYGAGSGLLAGGLAAVFTLGLWLGSLLGLFGQSFAQAAVHFLRGTAMMGFLLVLAVPFLVAAVVFVLCAMGLAGAVGASARGSADVTD